MKKVDKIVDLNKIETSLSVLTKEIGGAIDEYGFDKVSESLASSLGSKIHSDKEYNLIETLFDFDRPALKDRRYRLSEGLRLVTNKGVSDLLQYVQASNKLARKVKTNKKVNSNELKGLAQIIEYFGSDILHEIINDLDDRSWAYKEDLEKLFKEHA